MSEQLKLILSRDALGAFQLWACRESGKGCERNRYRAARVQCEDCLGPLPHDMTLEEVQQKLAQGDA